MAFRNSLSPLPPFYLLLSQKKTKTNKQIKKHKAETNPTPESEFNPYSGLGTFAYNKLLLVNPVKGEGQEDPYPTLHSLSTHQHWSWQKSPARTAQLGPRWRWPWGACKAGLRRVILSLVSSFWGYKWAQCEVYSLSGTWKSLNVRVWNVVIKYPWVNM